MNSRALTKAYKNEYDVHIKGRLLLVIRVSSYKQLIESLANELHQARSWAYKWYKRYCDEDLEGLKDKSRSGKPSIISKEVKDEIKQELSYRNIG